MDNFSEQIVYFVCLSFTSLTKGEHKMNRGVELLVRLFEIEPETRKWFDFKTGDAAAQMITSRRLMFLAYRATKSELF